MTSHRPLHLRLWQSALLFCVAFYAFAQLGSFLSMRGSPYISYWLPAGLYVGVLLLHETRAWPWFILASMAVNLLFLLPKGIEFTTALGFCAANSLEGFAGAWLVRRFVSERPKLGTVREFMGFLVCSPILSAMLGAGIGAAMLLWVGVHSSFWRTFLLWWSNNALAILLVSPLVLVWFGESDANYPTNKVRGRSPEAILLAAALTGLAWYMLVEGPGVDGRFTSWLLPLLVWAGMRFGLRGATLANLWLALLMAYFTTHYQRGLTPAEITSGLYVTTLQSFLMIAVIVALIPTIVVAERNQKVVELAQSEDRFRHLTQAAFEGVFISENGRILDVNDQGLRLFGYAREEMIGKNIIDLVAPESLEKVREAVRTGRELIYGHRLVRKDGSVFWAEAQAKMVRAGHRTVRMTALRDVTEQLRAEESLREASQFNRQIIGSTHEGIVVFDRELRYQVWNPFMENLTGVPAARVVAKRMEEAFPFLQDVGMRAALEKALAGEISGPMDFPFQIPETGREGWTSRVIAPLRNTRGEIIGVISSVRDITRRKQMEEALRKSEEQYRSIFTHAPVGIFQSTVERILLVNPAMARMFGFGSPEEMLAGAGSPDACYVNPEDRGLLIREAVASGTYACREIEERRRDGSTFISAVSMRTVLDDAGKIEFLEGFIEDITERKKAEAALKLSDFSVHHGSVATFWVTRDARIVRTNRAASELLGYTEDELLRLSISDLNPARTAESWARHWHELQARKHLTIEAPTRRKDGHVLQTEVDLNWFEFGGVEYNFAFMRDISARVQAEQRIQKSHEQLRALSARLQSLREEERTRLAREIHDHLGQLLTALKLDLRRMERRIETLPAGELREGLRGKLASANGLADETIDSIQQIAAELRPAILDRVGLEAAVESESKAFQLRAGIACDLSLPATPLDLSQDQATAVFRIFQETLTNVARHARAHRVSVKLSREDGSLLLAVADDGVGIDPSVLEQSQSLGLLGMRERAEILGGHVQFGRNPESGTTVTLRLPLHPPAIKEPAPRDSIAAATN